MKQEHNQEPIGVLFAWAIGRAVRQIGLMGAVAVLAAAPLMALASMTAARGEYLRLRAQTASALTAARRAELGLDALRAAREATVSLGCAGYPPTPAPEPPECSGDLGIEPIARGRYAVPRHAVECMLERSTRLRPVRVLPEMSKGRVMGVRLFGVTRGDALWALGLRTGDVLVTVNHYDISSPDHALEAYSTARRSPIVTVGIVRDATPRELRYYVTSW